VEKLEDAAKYLPLKGLSYTANFLSKPATPCSITNNISATQKASITSCCYVRNHSLSFFVNKSTIDAFFIVPGLDKHCPSKF
jgi:hypothetical protein